MAKVIVVEGPDKHGKSTQAKMLHAALSKMVTRNYPFDGRDNDVVLVKIPSAGATSKLIYWMLGNGLARKFPTLFQLVHFTNKLMFQTFTLPKLSRQHDFVIVDRWSLSAMAYGKAEGVSDRLNEMMFSALRQPDITFVLHGETFTRKTTTDDSYEKDSDMQSRVKGNYVTLAASLPNHVLVDNSPGRDAVHETIMDELRDRGIVVDVLRNLHPRGEAC